MEKIYGMTELHNFVQQIGKKSFVLCYGLYEDEQGKYEYRHYFDHKPSASELQGLINATIDAETERKILSGLKWQGKPVWLSKENQLNFKAAYDYAYQTNGITLPITFKLGENEAGKPIYHTFETLEDFADFQQAIVQHVQQALAAGWAEKDSIDTDSLLREE